MVTDGIYLSPLGIIGQMAEGITVSAFQKLTNPKPMPEMRSPRLIYNSEPPQSLRGWWHELALKVEVKGEESYN